MSRGEGREHAAGSHEPRGRTEPRRVRIGCESGPSVAVLTPEPQVSLWALFECCWWRPWPPFSSRLPRRNRTFAATWANFTMAPSRFFGASQVRTRPGDRHHEPGTRRNTELQGATVAGKAILSFKPIAKPLAELRLDAVALHVQSVESSEKVMGHQVTENKLVITFAAPIPAGKEANVTIAYSAEPERGLYFRTPEMGYKEGDTHLFTQGEAIEARHWYPCFDAPNEKFTSEITCRAPEGMMVLSNGRLISEKETSPD